MSYSVYKFMHKVLLPYGNEAETDNLHPHANNTNASPLTHSKRLVI